MAATGRVLGVDPGTVATGWGIVEECRGGVSHVGSGVLRLRGARADRLGRIYDELTRLCVDFAPEVMVVEKTFVGDNVQSAFRLGEARGAAMVAAAKQGIPVSEYSPAEIKVAVAGNGRAEKGQVQEMVQRLLHLAKRPAADEADALAAAICHAHRGPLAAHGEAVHGARSWRAYRVP